ncbi:retrovirus-related pol polyprotein from transposon TNT 1-94 [Tanacetum coccineum]
MNARVKSKSVKKSLKRKVWNQQERITTTTEVPLRIPSPLDNETPKPVVTLVYLQKPRKSKTNVPVSKSKVFKSVSANKKEPSQSWGSIVSDVPSSSLAECRLSKLFSIKFKNDHVAKILGYGDYQIGNVIISKVYYVEGRGHNLFSVGQFCDSNLEVAFRQHTCFIRNLEGVDLLTGSRGNNLYTLSLRDMMVSSPISRHGLVRGLPKLKFEKDHLCSACAIGKSKKKPYKPKSEDTNQEKLYLLHMDLCGPMRVASVNGKKYILVIVDDYSRFTWVKFLRSKDEAPDFIIKFLKMIQLRLKVPVRRIRTDNGTEFVNQTLREYYEKVGLVPNPPPSTPFVPPSRTDWDMLFQPLFDELLNPPPSVDHPAPEVVAPIDEVAAPEPAVSTGITLPSTTVDQDAPSTKIRNWMSYKEGKAVDPSHYCGMIGTLLYLTASRPDLQFAICMCARYQARPTEKHLHAVKRIFRYPRGTVNRGLWYPKDSSIALTTFADADHAGCQDTHRSTSGIMAIIGR